MHKFAVYLIYIKNYIVNNYFFKFNNYFIFKELYCENGYKAVRCKRTGRNSISQYRQIILTQ